MHRKHNKDGCIHHMNNKYCVVNIHTTQEML